MTDTFERLKATAVDRDGQLMASSSGDISRRDMVGVLAASSLGLTRLTPPYVPQHGARLQRGAQDAAILIRSGRVVNASGAQEADVRIVGDTIVEIGPSLSMSPDTRVIDAAGKLVIPGGIDPHGSSG